MKLSMPAPEIPDDAGFHRDLDIFERRPFGEALAKLMMSPDEQIVFALDAPWGEGKSTFVKMWRGHLANLDDSLPTIYFDAFEQDHQTDPFLALSSQIYGALERESDDQVSRDFKSKAMSMLWASGKSALRMAVRVGSGGLVDGSVLDDAGAESEVAGLMDNAIDTYLESANQHEQERKAFKACLAEVARALGGDKPVIFIIDELDRCRPDFALSILETIKHFFGTPRFKFLLVLNRKQLEESVRCTYGSGVDASRYLQKFVDIWANLPRRSLQGINVQRYLEHCLREMEFKMLVEAERAIGITLSELIPLYDLSLRDVEKILTNIALASISLSGLENTENLGTLVYLATIKVIHPDVYQDVLHERISYSDLADRTSLQKLGTPEDSSFENEHEIRWWIRYLMADSEKRRQMVQEAGPYGPRRSGPSLSQLATNLELFEKW